MPYSIKSYSIGLRAGLLLLCLVCAGHGPALASIPASGGAPQSGITASWETDLDETIGHARISLRPILVFFTGPDCLTCAQVKRFSLAHESLQPLIREFERVEIDLARRPELARAFQVAKIPSLYVIAPEGRIKGRTEGYATAKALEAFLRQMLAGDLSPLEINRLMAALESGQASREQWRKALLAMEDNTVRDRLQALAGGLSPGDIKRLTDCLTDPLLAVRLGALDLLENLNDTIIGLDPWSDLDAGHQEEALARWRTWSRANQGAPLNTAVLTQEKFDRYLQDLIGDDPQRSRRAVQALAQGGAQTAAFIAGYLNNNPKLDMSALRRIKEVQYSLFIPASAGLNPQATAHGIIWGNQDVQIRCIRQLADCGMEPSPILVDLLEHEDPLVRETAVEVLFNAAGPLAVAPAKALLDREKDPDICFTVLKHMGDINTPDSQRILASFFTHEHEDLVIAAVQGTVKSSTGALGAKLLPLLEDPRWRVRVAAIEALKEKGGYESGFYDRLQGKKMAVPEPVCKALFRCLDDPDEFVRHTAAVTLGELKVDGAESPLRAAYAKHPEMHGVIVSVLMALGVSLPSAYIDALFGPDADDLLFVLDRVKEVSGDSRELIQRAAESENPDIACSALRIAAKSETRNASDNDLLMAALRSGMPEKQLTVIQDFDLDSDEAKSVRETMKKNTPAEKTVPLLSRTTASDVLFAVADLMHDPAASDLVRADAMVLLCRYGYPDAFTRATAAWPDMTSSMRAAVAQSMPFFGQEAVPLFNLALDDDHTDVWEAALRHLADNDGRKWFAEPVRQYLSNPASRLTPAMIWPEGLDSLCRQAPEALKPFAKTVIAEPRSFQPDRVILALAVLSHAQIEEDERHLITGLTQDPNPLIRRAAWIALAGRSEEAIQNNFESILADSSKYVREILPALLYNNLYDNTEITLYFSEEVYFTGYEGLRIARRTSEDYGYTHRKPMSPETIGKIKSMLKDDPDPLIRFRCMLCLLSHRIPLDLNEVYTTAKQIGSPPLVADLIADFFSTHGHGLGENFSILIPLLQTSEGKHHRAYVAESLLERWGGKRPPLNAARISFSAVEKKEPPQLAMATFMDGPAESVYQIESPIEAVLFSTAGCRNCFAAEKIIQFVKLMHPGLRVTRHDLLTREGFAYNDVLSRRFGIDAASHATAPAVFMAGGSLAGAEITYFSFEELVSRSDEGSMPLAVSAEELKTAHAFIEERRKTYTWFGLAGMGFAGGLSPYVLAALLLLLRYLSHAGQTGPSIQRHGALYLASAAAVSLGLWLIPQVDITTGTYLHNAGGVLLWLIPISMLLIALRLFFGSLWRLRKKAATKSKGAKNHEPPGPRYVTGIVVLWAAILSILDTTGMGTAQTITLVYGIKHQVMTISSILMLLTFCVAFMLPSAGVIWFFARLTASKKIESFSARHGLMANTAFSMMWFGLAIGCFQLV